MRHIMRGWAECDEFARRYKALAETDGQNNPHLLEALESQFKGWDNRRHTEEMCLLAEIAVQCSSAKLLDAPKLPDEQRGFYRKYVVLKADGSPVDPEAEYLVLRLDTDEAACQAAFCYTRHAFEKYPQFCRELIARVKELREQISEREQEEKNSPQTVMLGGRFYDAEKLRRHEPHLQPDTIKVGGHVYDADGTSDCHNGCGCWMGPYRSGGPEGIDPAGACPNAPKHGGQAEDLPTPGYGTVSAEKKQEEAKPE